MAARKQSKKSWLHKIKKRYSAYINSRAHRSFRPTRRRDIPGHAPLPGYFAFTGQVLGTIKEAKRTFAGLLVIYFVVTLSIVGFAQLDQYRLVQDALGITETSTETNSNDLGANFSLFSIAIAGGLNQTLGEGGQIYLALVGLLMWLVVIWLLRRHLSKTRVRVRDGLYNAGAPIISTALILGLMIIQLIPAALGLAAYSVAQTAGLIQGGVEAMLFATAGLLLGVLSLYWLSSSFIAALIVTIPGTYPMQAIRSASDIVIGRRVSVMLRLLWLAAMVLIFWTVVLLPVIWLDAALGIYWLPLVPITLQLLGGMTLLLATTYVYLLYRKMIDEPAK